MTDPVLLCVDPDLVEDFWPEVRGFIAAVFAEGRGDDDETVLFEDLKAKRSLLWIVWDQRKILAAVITQLTTTTRGRICRITACGGIELKRWAHLISGIETYAEAERCSAVRFEGRKGWGAVFPDYREPWIVLEKRL